MIDTTNKEARYIITPDGKAQIDYFILGKTGVIDKVMVWLGEYDPKTSKMRPHLFYKAEECEEVER